MPRRRRIVVRRKEVLLVTSARAVMPAIAATHLEARLPGGNIEVVVHHENSRRRDSVKARELGDRFAREWFMKAIGLSNQISRPATAKRANLAVETRFVFERHAVPMSRASRKRNPALCRVSAYSAPGLPRLTEE